MFAVEKYKMLLPRSVKNNMHQTNTYFCDELLRAVYFQIKRVKKYLKKKFEKASISVFHCACFLGTLKVLLYEIHRFVKKFESHLFKVSWSEKAFLINFYLFFPKLQRKYKQNINKTEYTIMYNVTILKFLWKKVK